VVKKNKTRSFTYKKGRKRRGQEEYPVKQTEKRKKNQTIFDEVGPKEGKKAGIRFPEGRTSSGRRKYKDRVAFDPAEKGEKRALSNKKKIKNGRSESQRKKGGFPGYSGQGVSPPARTKGKKGDGANTGEGKRKLCPAGKKKRPYMFT